MVGARKVKIKIPPIPLPYDLERQLIWSKSWNEQIKNIVGPFLLRDSTPEEDKMQGTDILVFHADGVRIACRLRTPGYNNFSDDFTITYQREDGWPCEWDKIIEDTWADWFFYGHAVQEKPENGRIKPWFILDLALLRAGISLLTLRKEDWNRAPEGYRCKFRAYSVSEALSRLGPRIIIGRWRP